jgi:hypothetical protein
MEDPHHSINPSFHLLDYIMDRQWFQLTKKPDKEIPYRALLFLKFLTIRAQETNSKYIAQG